jgi:hypothetical protein
MIDYKMLWRPTGKLGAGKADYLPTWGAKKLDFISSCSHACLTLITIRTSAPQKNYRRLFVVELSTLILLSFDASCVYRITKPLFQIAQVDKKMLRHEDHYIQREI